MNCFEVIIASSPDRKKLVAEIWWDSIHIAEVNQENEKLEIELYAGQNFKFSYEEFLRVLEDAKSKLHGLTGI